MGHRELFTLQRVHVILAVGIIGKGNDALPPADLFTDIIDNCLCLGAAETAVDKIILHINDDQKLVLHDTTSIMIRVRRTPASFCGGLWTDASSRNSTICACGGHIPCCGNDPPPWIRAYCAVSCIPPLSVWRRERDSNPRRLSASLVFKTSALNRSAISPEGIRKRPVIRGRHSKS